MLTGRVKKDERIRKGKQYRDQPLGFHDEEIVWAFGVVVSTLDCAAGDPGSIPGRSTSSQVKSLSLSD